MDILMEEGVAGVDLDLDHIVYVGEVIKIGIITFPGHKFNVNSNTIRGINQYILLMD